MSETPEERLARLRREVERDLTPPSTAQAMPAAPGSAPAPASDLDAGGDPEAHETPSSAPASAQQDGVEPVPAARPPAPVRQPADAAALRPSLTPPPTASAGPEPVVGGPVPVPPPRSAGATGPQAWTPGTRPVQTAASSGQPTEDDGWSLADALGGASLGRWVGIGLVVVGGYLVLATVVPGIALPGSLLMAAVGAVLLWLHLTHRGGAWALYAGAVLAAVGALRVVADLLPFEVRGETSLGLGVALLAISWLRHAQAGGWGWQGVLGGVALAWGAIQFGLGLLPGAPGVLDLVLPVLILGAGVVLLVRALGRRRA